MRHVTEIRNMTDLSIVRAASLESIDLANAFFTSLGFDNPVRPDRIDSHVTVLLDGDMVRGAAYAAHADGVGDTLLSHYGVEGLAVTAQIQSLDAIAVDPKYRGRGYGTALLNSVAAHAYRDFDARYFVTRIDAEKTRALSWFEDRGFEICKPGVSFTVAGVTMMPAAGYRDAWAHLSDLPVFTRR